MSKTNKDISKRIRDDHLHMKTAIRDIRKLIKEEVKPESFTPWIKNLQKILSYFNTEIHEHFELEEDGGFMDDVLKLKPQKKYAVSQLKTEHELMSTDLRRIIKCVDEAGTYDEIKKINLTQRIRDFLDLLSVHEAEENLLLEDLYLQDDGIAD